MTKIKGNQSKINSLIRPNGNGQTVVIQIFEPLEIWFFVRTIMSKEIKFIVLSIKYDSLLNRSKFYVLLDDTVRNTCLLKADINQMVILKLLHEG